MNALNYETRFNAASENKSTLFTCGIKAPNVGSRIERGSLSAQAIRSLKSMLYDAYLAGFSGLITRMSPVVGMVEVRGV